MPRRIVVPLATSGLLVLAALAAAPATLAGGGCHADVTGNVHTDGETSVVRMDVCSFEPTVARVPVGGTVTFLNTATLDHIVLGRGQSWGGGDNLQPGDSVRATFGEAGVFPYSCPLHPGMVGTIVVGDADTPPPAMGAEVAGGAPEVPAPAAPDGTASTTTTGGIDPAVAVGVGGVAGLAVLGLGAGILAARRRPSEELASR